MTKLDKKRLLWLLSGLILTAIVGALLFFSANAMTMMVQSPRRGNMTGTCKNQDGKLMRYNDKAGLRRFI